MWWSRRWWVRTSLLLRMRRCGPRGDRARRACLVTIECISFTRIIPYRPERQGGARGPARPAFAGGSGGGPDVRHRARHRRAWAAPSPRSTPGGTETTPRGSGSSRSRRRWPPPRRPRRPSSPADPTAVLQPVTEKVRHDTQIAFITIMSPGGTRYTHTDPSLIGQTYLGTTAPALRGETFTEVFTGTLGPSIRAVAPVYASDGRIVGLVSAGITQQTLAENWQAQLPLILLVAATTVGRRRRRHGAGPPPPAPPDRRTVAAGPAGDVRAPRRGAALDQRGARRGRRTTARCSSTTRPGGCSGCRARCRSTCGRCRRSSRTR